MFTVVCGSFWRVDKIQNEVTMETEVPKLWGGMTSAIALQWQF
jgi:hypothetical protein